MFVGRSEEEVALAGEEMGFSITDVIKKIVTDPRSAGIAAGAIFGPAAAIAASKIVESQQSKPAPKAAPKATDDGGSKEVASDEGAPKSKKGGGDVMGAGSFSDEHIEALISRERDPDKKARMVYNHERAKRMRRTSAVVGAALGVVDNAIGQLFARTPVDSQSRPTLTVDNLRKLVALVATKVGSPKKARALVASYVRINKIATPGLRVVKKG